jgi:hypothetical protein
MRDPKTENYLRDGGYTFRFHPSFELSQIDIDVAKENPWRLHRRFDEYRVNAIGCALLEGADLPAIVLYDDQDAYRLVTGLHRTLGAQDAKKAALDAYLIVETDPYRRSLLARSINVIEGAAPTEQENLEQIVDLLQEYPDRTAADIARAFHMKATTIERHVRIAKVEQRAADLGVSATFANGVLSRRLKDMLGGIKSDPIFMRTARVVVDTKARGSVAEVLIRDVQRSRSEAAAYKILDAREQEHVEEEEAARAKFGRPRTSIPTKAMYAVRRVWKFDDHPAWGGLEPSEVKRSITVLRETLSKIKRWERELVEVSKQHEKRDVWKKTTDATVATVRRGGGMPSAPISPVV